MKLIEGLKQQKHIAKKIEDLQAKIRQHSAYASIERPVYRDEKDPDSPAIQTQQINSWVQSCLDLVKYMVQLRLRIQYTNIVTLVTIQIGQSRSITKTIAEWIHWRRELCDMMYRTHAQLTDKNIKEGQLKNSQGEIVDIKIVRCYSPAQRDSTMAEYMDLKNSIDSTLEIVNATTDMVEIGDLAMVIEKHNNVEPEPVPPIIINESEKQSDGNSEEIK